MADEHRRGQDGEPVPRDLPDQLAHEGEDPWDPDLGEADRDGSAEDVPDADEAGAGRQGTPRSATVHPEHPAPDESSA
ncbi:hypothetical protein ACIQI8_02725 [Streptomyces sp. NPDC092369]|uniref:hypothetical protein n=1 Tax=Streptomyces sp. NPDC092369 TaxID=3366015 RepID=UPI00382B989F